jgi:biotin carboxylase
LAEKAAMSDVVERILCISTYEKGQDFLRQCADMGVKPTLLTLEKHKNGDWPREALEELVTIPEGLTREQIIHTVAFMFRGRRFEVIVALDEFDQEVAAYLREHLQIAGMSVTTTGHYRDKLAMRTRALHTGFLVPEFTRVANYDELRAFMDRVPAPWLLKPRSSASAIGIRRIQDSEQLWRTLSELGDEQSHFVLERFVPGDIYHVDSIVSERQVIFSIAHKYGKPPMQVMHEGGVFTTRTVDRNSPDCQQLVLLNARLAPALGMVRGVTHAEYIRAHADGKFYFLEIAARVGGAFISDLIQASTGVNLWREWARLEIGPVRGEQYLLPPTYCEYAGSVLCLAQTAEPDTSAFDAPEIVYRMKKHHHAGVIVRSPQVGRVEELVDTYSKEFARRFLASMPAPEKPTA